MNWIETVTLGIVEGITEFLPVSSTGHLILTSHLLGLHGEVIDSFEVFIQLGAILAVIWLYKSRFLMLFDFSSTQRFSGRRGWFLLLTTSIPAGILGALFEHSIKAHLFNYYTVAWALGLGGIIIILVEQIKFKHKTTELNDLTFKQAFLIGCFQCLALWPGASRSASTIIGGLVSGLNRQVAAEYSFLAAVPVLVAVTLHDLIKILPKLTLNDMTMYGVGLVVAFISAIFAVKLFIQFLQRSTLIPFGVYRILVAILFLGLLH